LRVFNIAAKWLFILSLPGLLLTASIAWAVNSLWLYEYGFEKYDISRTTGLAQPELEKAAVGLISYFNSEKEPISLAVVKEGKPFELFNEREVIHLKDVKGLFWLNYRVLIGTLIYVLLYAGVNLFWWKDRRQLAWGLASGGGLTFVLILALGLGALLNFERLFHQFHLISFANDFWQLDPTRDYLIMLFPGGFWYDMTMFCALATVMGAIVLGGTGTAYLLYSRRKAAP